MVTSLPSHYRIIHHLLDNLDALQGLASECRGKTVRLSLNVVAHGYSGIASDMCHRVRVNGFACTYKCQSCIPHFRELNVGSNRVQQGSNKVQQLLPHRESVWLALGV